MKMAYLFNLMKKLKRYDGLQLINFLKTDGPGTDLALTLCGLKLLAKF